MLPKMQYRLGLDLGTTSIGWCLIRLNKNNDPIAIIRMGSRIFSDGRNPKDGSSLAVTRREARQARRRRDRLIKRKERMHAALIRLGFFPEDEKERKKLLKINPYTLRKRGLYESLSGPEFARALFHINQRRGFLSNRKTDAKDNEGGALKKAIKDLRKKFESDDCKTLGEWLANRNERGESVRARLRGKTQKDKAYDFYADRAMVEHEFDLLWEKQSSYNPVLYSDTSRDELKDILLFQRPLKPVIPGRCTLIPDEERAPLASPNTQRFRIYQELNNLRILTSDIKEQPLSIDHRNKIASLLEQGDATFKKIIKTLNLPTNTSFNLQDIKRDRLKGNQTSKILAKEKCFGNQWHEFNHSLQNMIVDKLLNEASEKVLNDWLIEHTNVDELTAENIANSNLPEGYGKLSRLALDRILPELINDVVVYSEAVLRAGFESHSALSHTQQSGEIMQDLPYYGEYLQRHVGFGSGILEDVPEKRYGKIANPTVHIGLNEIRKVVNAIIKKYGHPSEVIIEVTRSLKLSRERKNNIEKDQKVRQDRNTRLVEEACQALGLTSSNIDRGKRRELSQKMQLWEELNPKDPANRRCPYTGEQISINRLLSNEVEIEHILPYSMTLDDSLTNKTVAMRRANRDKGNKTPYEAFGRQSLPDYDYPAILERASLMYRAKGRRFAEDGYEQWVGDGKDFLARALNDTAYISHIAKEYLSLICPPNNVRSIPGRMTALLRGKYGLNHLLSGTELKNRDDHRHHALDAAVIGITDQGLLQRFSNASAMAKDKHLNRLVDDMPQPWPTYREHVERSLASIVVSHRPDHSYQGSMHMDTAWGIRNDGQTTKRVRPEDGGPRSRIYKNQNLILMNATNDLHRHGIDDNQEPKAYKGYVGGNNYCIEIWHDENGKWNSDVITTFQAYQIIRKIGEEAGYQQLRNKHLSQSDQPLVMRLMINDMLKMEIDGVRKIMRVVKVSRSGQIFFAEHNEANVDSRNRNKEDTFSYISKSAGSLKKANGSQIIVSKLGDCRLIRNCLKK